MCLHNNTSKKRKVYKMNLSLACLVFLKIKVNLLNSNQHKWFRSPKKKKKKTASGWEWEAGLESVSWSLDKHCAVEREKKKL